MKELINMILCAAINITFVNSNNEINHLTVCGRRHGDCYKTIRQLDNKHTQWSEEGFITRDGVFLNRKDAFKHACHCGQLSQSTLWYKEDNKIEELESEDLY